MERILVIGAGKTSIYLIEYLLANAAKNKWEVVVADSNMEAIQDKTNNNPFSVAEVVDITNANARERLVKQSDIVISLLPPFLHILVAKDCLTHKKHLITSSYITPEMQSLNNAAKKNGLMFMCEMGVDPGIDHMTAAKAIHSVQKVAGAVTSFRSYAGGLIAPESDDNPWHYKFTWNPKNVVLAGKDGAKFLDNGNITTIAYKDLYAQQNDFQKLDGIPDLEYYGNRDAISYLDKYNLPEAKDFFRATLRYKGFMKSWNVLVQLGLTDDTDNIVDTTYASWIINKNNFDTDRPLNLQIAEKMNVAADDKCIQDVAWLGILANENVANINKSSADILLDVLLDKWALQPTDKDMIIMQHDINYAHRRGNNTTLTSAMILKAENSKYSAMAKAVGMPMAVLAKLVLTKKITPPTGVLIPDMPTIYKPVLAELATHGIVFNEYVE